MNNIYEYQQQLATNTESYQNLYSKINDSYNKKAAQIKEALEPIGIEFLREGLQPAVRKLATGITKNLQSKAKTYIEDKLSGYKQIKPLNGRLDNLQQQVKAKEEAEQEDTPEEAQTTQEQILNQDPEELLGESLTTTEPTIMRSYSTSDNIGNIISDPEKFQQWTRDTFPDIAQQQGTEGIEEARQQLLAQADDLNLSTPIADYTARAGNYLDNLQPGYRVLHDMTNQDGSIKANLNMSNETQPSTEQALNAEETSNLDDISNTASNVVKTQADNITNKLTSVETGGEEVASTASSADSALAETSTALDIDPVTSIIGIAVGLGSLLGGIFSHPHKPKAPPMINTSITYGA